MGYQPHRRKAQFLLAMVFMATSSLSLAQITPQAARTRQAEMRNLQREIAVNPVAVTERVRDRAATTAAATPAVATPTETAPAAPAPTPAATSIPDAAPAPAETAPAAADAAVFQVAPQTLERGKIYYARVSPAQESVFKSFVEANVQTLAKDAPIVTIPGVARAVSVNGEEVQFKPYIYAGDPLRYEFESSRFHGKFYVGVAALSEGPQDLSAPVVFQALETDSVTPGKLDVARAGPPFEAMDVDVADANAEVTLRVVTQYSPDVMSVTLPLAPTTRITPSTTQIQAYGLGTTLVSVTVVGLANPEGRKVMVTATPRGSFEPAEVVLDKFGSASTTLRSDGQGQAALSAVMFGATPIPSAVTFELPTETVIAALIGGLLGAMVRLLPQKRRGASRKFLVGVIVAVLTGFFGFAIYAIGVNLLPFQPTVTKGAILVFALSAVFAYLGSTWLDRLGGPDAGEKKP